MLLANVWRFFIIFSFYYLFVCFFTIFFTIFFYCFCTKVQRVKCALTLEDPDELIFKSAQLATTTNMRSNNSHSPTFASDEMRERATLWRAMVMYTYTDIGLFASSESFYGEIPVKNKKKRNKSAFQVYILHIAICCCCKRSASISRKAHNTKKLRRIFLMYTTLGALHMCVYIDMYLCNSKWDKPYERNWW